MNKYKYILCAIILNCNNDPISTNCWKGWHPHDITYLICQWYTGRTKKPWGAHPALTRRAWLLWGQDSTHFTVNCWIWLFWERTTSPFLRYSGNILGECEHVTCTRFLDRSSVRVYFAVNSMGLVLLWRVPCEALARTSLEQCRMEMVGISLPGTGAYPRKRGHKNNLRNFVSLRL